MKCEDEKTSAPSQTEAQRPYRSFFIADILGSHTERDRTSEEPFEKKNDTKQYEGRGRESSMGTTDSVEATSSQRFSTKVENLLANLKTRSPFLAEQREALEKTFQQTKYISSCKRKELAMELNLTERQIKTWFQNRRTKWRKVRGNDNLRRQEMLKMSNTGVAQILSNIDEGIEGLPRDCVVTLYRLLSNQ